MKLAQDDLSGAIAGEVRAWMARRQCSSRKAAARLGWTETYLSRRLTGAVPFSVAEIAMIADLLEVPVSTFFEIPQGGLMFDNTCGWDDDDDDLSELCSDCRSGAHCDGDTGWCCCPCGWPDEACSESLYASRAGLGLAA